MAGPSPQSPGFIPAPQPPRRASSRGVLIALLVLLLIFAGAAAAIFFGVRIISRSVSIRERRTAAGNKVVSINTPVGSLNVRQGGQVDPALIGLPVYPGAVRMKDKDSARVNLTLPGRETVGLVTAKFQTSDALVKVKSYYQSQLNGQITNTATEDFGQKIVFRIKRNHQERVVALKNSGGGTEITLVLVRHGTAEAN